jgi:hypothetical protein
MKRNGQHLPMLREIREAHGSNPVRREYERYLLFNGYLFRPISFLLTWVAIRMGATSEGVSWLSGAVGLAGCALLVSGSQEAALVGIGVLFLFNLLDCVDGDIARSMKTQNPYGRFLDSVCGGVIDLAFWGIVGIMAFQHPQLLCWPQPFGYGPVFWLAVGGATCFLSIWMGYLEMCFDELLRPAWDRIRETETATNTSVSAVDSRSSVEPLNGRPASVWARAILTNLRVRETHYALLLAAYMTATVDFLLTAYVICYATYNLSLLAVYAKRGREVRALHSTGPSPGTVLGRSEP